MPIAVDPSRPYEYVLKCDRDEDGVPQDDPNADEPWRRRVTRFKLKPLTVKEQATVEDALAAFDPASGKGEVMSGTQTVTILRLGLVGWANLWSRNPKAGEDGQPDFVEVPFEVAQNGKTKGQVTNACLDRLTPGWRAELANEITSRGHVSEADRGNS